jgi:hypothetical protein
MSLFRRLFSRKDPVDTPERLELLEKQMRRLEEEWTDVYAKFRVMQMRVAKQVQRLPESSEEEPQAGERTSDGEVGRLTSSLSPRLQKIQNDILARRGNRSITTKVGE